MKLLIVDDHDTNLKLLRVQLEIEDHSVVEAGNGVEALEVLARETVDGVISDILMPRMDGYRLCLEVRRDARLHQLPFVLYTSTYNSPADRKLAESAGADAYIEKPAPTRALLDAIEAAAQRSHPLRSAALSEEIEAPVLKQYSESLIRKLEDKSLELARAHEGLVQVERRLSGLVESAMDAIIAVDEQHCILLFNAAAGQLFGVAPAAAIGRSLNDFLPQRFRDAHTRQIDVFSREGQRERPMTGRTVWAMHSNGTEFPIEATISKLSTSQGRIFTVFIRDMTERHRSQQALARSEAGLRRAQDLARLAHLASSEGGRIVSWSPTLPHLLGLDADGDIPLDLQAWAEHVHADDRERFLERVAQLDLDDSRRDIEYRMIVGGRTVTLRQVMEPVPPGSRESTAGATWCFHTVQDVTEQKKTEARILRLNRVHSMLSGTNGLIVRVRERDDLFRGACRLAVDAGNFLRAWIGLLQDDGSLRIAAQYGGADEFFSALAALVSNGDWSRTAIARVVLAGQPYVSNDLKNDPNVLTRDYAVTSGSRSMAAFPLLQAGRTIGAMMLHSQTPDFFDDEELSLLGELARDISFALEHLQTAAQLRYLDDFDAVTGLPNRRQFIERLSQRIDAGGDKADMLAVLLVDLVRFRHINESLGRAGGDDLLKEVAARVKACNATVACVGAGVFALLVSDRHSAAEMARTVEDYAARCFGDVLTVQGSELRLGVRTGVAVFPTDGADAETLLRNAEAALRRAKSRNVPCVFYAPEMDARAAETLAMETKLRRAIERNEFVLHYQPKVRFSDMRISGVEALIRWQDPENGLIPPIRFIPILEESGLIGIVGHWALRQSMADHRRWRDAGLGALRVAVNVSPLQLQHPDFTASIGEVIALDGGAALKLEITESVLMENLERNAAALAQIRALGVDIAIDDFGTGYCSLAYLAKLPVTSLKIDRTFVNGMTEGPEGMAIVSSIIALAHALRLRVVAEGVETEEQARLLRLLACDEAQGYLYSRPVTADAIEALLKAGGRLPQA
jgi:PAS domain S-box-containing protein/diguanylate cyclase (GGDEF)-like protein